MAKAQLDDEVLQRVFEAWRELRRGAVRKLNDDFYGRWPDALDPAQMDILEMIVSQPSWRMSQLAQALHLDPSTVTRSIDRLVGSKLARRVPAADDGRGVQVRATASGRALCKKVPEHRRDVMREVLRGMSQREADQLARLMEKMVDGVAAHAQRVETAESTDRVPSSWPV
jgi:DNA-binding MarR family transcriptional regulator